ncbi:MAG: ankyrin repeat domain-containing protein [Nitrospinota bacterium]|nr:ankyrin repeat domain-containing protein [Nitrospinota bacterium]
MIETANKLSKAGDIAGLGEWLQKKGNDPNLYSKEGWTPLLWASVRGRHEAVDLLLKNGADIAIPHGKSKALAVHLAGQSGSVRTAEILLDHKPDHLNAVFDVNGHTILMNAVFYGHLELAEFLLKRGGDTSIPTARGLGAMEMASQFQNHRMMDLVRPYDTPAEAKAEAYKKYLDRIAPRIPESEKTEQELADKLVRVIEEGLKKVSTDPGASESTLATVKDLIEVRKVNVNRLGGPLQQPPLIVVATGNNGFPPNPDVARLRNQLAKYLLDKGADPMLHEKHPMDVQTIIRAAVFNHLEILKMCAEHMAPQRLAEGINEIPVVNGLTAMHDTVLRASTADSEHLEGYLAQIRFFIENGGRVDIEEFSGLTQRSIAEQAKDTNNRKRILEVIDGKA